MQLAAYHAYVGRNFTGLGSSRRCIASNFTDIHNYIMSNIIGIQKSAANKLLQKRNIPMSK